jgi:D-3-phosphoglycerate dehydrogenase
LGSFLGQITESGITRVDVEYEGHATTMNTGPLTSIILQNLLSPVLDQTVNMVNAETVAKARGIDVCETKHSREGDYTTLIRLTVVTQNTTRVIEGTLFSDQQPRIVHIMGIDVEAQLAPNMLFVTNMDEPGFIGSLGTLLGSAGVNIANFNLGREAGDRQNGALALIQVDEEISEDLLSQVCALPQVKLAKALSF